MLGITLPASLQQKSESTCRALTRNSLVQNYSQLFLDPSVPSSELDLECFELC